MELVLVLLLAAVAGWLVLGPLLRPSAAPGEGGGPPADLAELEAAKEAAYAELRDLELDHRTGKLSDEEFARQDADVRRRAVELLKRIDAARDAAGDA